jgi:endogenous inhibitor of DNA gyrase (YacG/DUF329 family)
MQQMATHTEQRYCPTCKKNYEATVTTERSGQEISARHISRCPDCGTDGQMLMTIDPRVRL